MLGAFVYILGILISILVGAGYWWWRLERARDAASGIVDAAQRARGAYSRARFRNKAYESVLAGVDDPAMAAVVYVYALCAAKAPLTAEEEASIEREAIDVCRMEPRDAQEALAFAIWATAQVPDINEIARRFTPLWRRTLSRDERADLVDMALRAASRRGAPTDAQRAAIRRLSESVLPA